MVAHNEKMPRRNNLALDAPEHRMALYEDAHSR